MASTYEALMLSLFSQLAVPVVSAPISTLTSGTVTSSTTETFDTVLGYYQCNLVAGRRYQLVLNGLLCGGSVANDLYTLRVRNSGTSSNPTTSSTIVAAGQWLCRIVGGPGEVTTQISHSFIAPSSGVNTFGFSAQRAVGSGAFTPLSLGGNPREMYVMYLGTV